MSFILKRAGQAFMEFLSPNSANVPSINYFGAVRTPSPAYQIHFLSFILRDQPVPRMPRDGSSKLTGGYYQRDTRRAPLPHLETTPEKMNPLYYSNSISGFPLTKSIPDLPFNPDQTDFSFQEIIKNDSITSEHLHLPPVPEYSYFLSEATGFTDFDDERTKLLPVLEDSMFERIGTPHPDNPQLRQPDKKTLLLDSKTLYNEDELLGVTAPRYNIEESKKLLE